MVGLPQEIQVDYVIPAIRRALAECLIYQHDYTQREAATRLDITPSAVSQYLDKKRGDTVELPQELDEAVTTAGRRIDDGESTPLEAIYNILTSTTGKEFTCEVHKKYSDVADDCRICFQKEVVP